MSRGFRDEDRDESDGHEPYSLGEGKVIVDTPNAIRVQLVEHDNTLHWFPKSVVHADSEIWSAESNGGAGKLVVKRWFARKEGFCED